MLNKTITFLFKNIFHYKLFKNFRILKKINILNFESNKEHQLQKLREVIKIAFTEIPFYKDLAINLEYENFSYTNFQRIPILTKDLIRSRGSDLINDNYFYKNQVHKNSSGGSTGEPVEFYRTKNQEIYGQSNYYFALFLNGVNIYDNSVDFWGAERDMYNPIKKFNLKAFVNNKVTLNTFVLSDKILDSYIKRLNKVKPSFIKAYVHSIYDMAKYINSKNIEIKFKPIIHCTTGPLYPEMRKEISNAFNNAYIYSFYGSREVSAIATEVKVEKGMFVLFDNVFVEILDDKNQPVNKGEEGEIVITTLNNHFMPLLRYKIGDRGIKGDESDFGTLRMQSVKGRTLGVIYEKEGRKIDGQFFTTLFFNKKGIKSFQLIQKSLSYLVLKIVKNDNFEKEDLDLIIQRIQNELGGVEIEIFFVDKIELTRTGKIMYVYSELN